jgi:hypothetical protein
MNGDVGSFVAKVAISAQSLAQLKVCHETPKNLQQI